MASFSFCAGRIWSRWAEGKWGGGLGGLGIPPSGCSKGVAIGADGIPFLSPSRALVAWLARMGLTDRR